MLDLKQNFNQELDQISRFIKEALDQVPSHLEIDSESDEEETLVLERELDQLEFLPIQETSFNGKVASVDGGSALILSGRSFLVGTYRAGFTIFQNGKRTDEFLEPLQFSIITRTNKEELHTKAYQELTGQSPSEAPEMDKILDRLRLFAEWKLAGQLLDRLDSGDVLLLDGSLRATVAIPDNYLEKITAKAAAKGIILVGVSKSTTLYWGDKSPLIPAVVKRSQELQVNQPWFARIGDLKRELEQSHWFGTVYIARFKHASDFAFRVDVNRHQQNSQEEVFSILSNLSCDPTFLGYPYTLAPTHAL